MPPSVIAKSKATKQSREGHGIATHLSGARNDERVWEGKETHFEESPFFATIERR